MRLSIVAGINVTCHVEFVHIQPIIPYLYLN